MDTEHVISTAPSIEPERMPSLTVLRGTVHLYHSNMALFLKLIAPAVVFGYIAIFVSQERATEIIRHLPHGPEVQYHLIELGEIWVVRVGGWLVSWLVYCFAFAGISVAVEQVDLGKAVTAAACFMPARRRLGALLRAGVLLFGGLLLLTGISMLASACVLIWIAPALHFQLSSSASFALGSGFALLAFLVISRFGLAIPALVLDDCGVAKSIFVSDEMTQGRWACLAVLLVESVGGSYLASVLPFWVAFAVAGNTPVPHWVPWFLDGLAIIGAALLVPNMLIGFALLYVRSRNSSEPASVLSGQAAE
jgi:hypothetical protein